MLKTITTKIKALSHAYKHTIHPHIQSTLNTSIIQPCKSLVRFHHLKKSYNQKYSLFITFSNTPIILIRQSICSYLSVTEFRSVRSGHSVSSGQTSLTNRIPDFSKKSLRGQRRDGYDQSSGSVNDKQRKAKWFIGNRT